MDGEATVSFGLRWFFPLSWVESERWGLFLVGNSERYSPLGRLMCSLSGELISLKNSPKTTEKSQCIVKTQKTGCLLLFIIFPLLFVPPQFSPIDKLFRRHYACFQASVSHIDSYFRGSTQIRAPSFNW